MSPLLLLYLRALCLLHLCATSAFAQSPTAPAVTPLPPPRPKSVHHRPPQNSSCVQCAWLRNTSAAAAAAATTAETDLPPPHLGLIFLHLRKAGGTAILNLLHTWMKHRRCDDEKDLGEPWGWNLYMGVYDGRYRNGLFPHKPTPQQLICPTLDIRHNEYGCILAPRLLGLPARAERRDVPFSLFTVIRDPIDRLISQAFYWGEHSPYELLKMRLPARCGKNYANKCTQPAFKAICECARAVREETMAELKTNSTFWFHWYHHNQGFNDRAMTNYYIKRLVGASESQSPQQVQASMVAAQVGARCLLHPDEVCHCEGDFLDKLGSSVGCKTTLSNTSAALELAKRVINEQLDFIIFERMHEDYSVHLLSRLLQEPSPAFIREHIRVEKNVGLHNTTRTGKAHLLPDDFVEFMRKENAADLELYEYAKRVFEARVRDEQWVYFSSYLQS